MEQVKLASGLDIQAIAEGNMDWTLYSRIPTVTVQPDSAHINVSAIMAMMKGGDGRDGGPSGGRALDRAPQRTAGDGGLYKNSLRESGGYFIWGVCGMISG